MHHCEEDGKEKTGTDHCYSKGTNHRASERKAARHLKEGRSIKGSKRISLTPATVLANYNFKNVFRDFSILRNKLTSKLENADPKLEAPQPSETLTDTWTGSSLQKRNRILTVFDPFPGYSVVNHQSHGRTAAVFLQRRLQQVTMSFSFGALCPCVHTASNHQPGGGAWWEFSRPEDWRQVEKNK